MDETSWDCYHLIEKLFDWISLLGSKLCEWNSIWIVSNNFTNNFNTDNNYQPLTTALRQELFKLTPLSGNSFRTMMVKCVILLNDVILQSFILPKAFYKALINSLTFFHHYAAFFLSSVQHCACRRSKKNENSGLSTLS